MADLIITTPTTATGNSSHLRKMTPDVETRTTSVPPEHVTSENAKTDAEEDFQEELKKRVVESLEAHRIASEATVKVFRRNVEVEATSSANISGDNAGSVTSRPDIICDFK